MSNDIRTNGADVIQGQFGPHKSWRHATIVSGPIRRGDSLNGCDTIVLAWVSGSRPTPYATWSSALLRNTVQL